MFDVIASVRARRADAREGNASAAALAGILALPATDSESVADFLASLRTAAKRPEPRTIARKRVALAQAEAAYAASKSAAARTALIAAGKAVAEAERCGTIARAYAERPAANDAAALGIERNGLSRAVTALKWAASNVPGFIRTLRLAAACESANDALALIRASMTADDAWHTFCERATLGNPPKERKDQPKPDSLGRLRGMLQSYLGLARATTITTLRQDVVQDVVAALRDAAPDLFSDVAEAMVRERAAIAAAAEAEAAELARIVASARAEMGPDAAAAMDAAAEAEAKRVLPPSPAAGRRRAG